MSNQDTPTLSFPKDEKLRHKSLVDALFKTGKSFYEFPLRATWRKISAEDLNSNFRDHVPQGIGPIQLLITIPKKKRKKAVDRVLLRRRIREAYRLNRLELKQALEQDKDLGTFSLALVYIHNQNLPYQIIEEKIRKILKKLQATALEPASACKQPSTN